MALRSRRRRRSGQAALQSTANGGWMQRGDDGSGWRWTRSSRGDLGKRSGRRGEAWSSEAVSVGHQDVLARGCWAVERRRLRCMVEGWLRWLFGETEGMPRCGSARWSQWWRSDRVALTGSRRASEVARWGAAWGERYGAREARQNWGKWIGEAGDAFYGLGVAGSCSREVTTGRRGGRHLGGGGSGFFLQDGVGEGSGVVGGEVSRSGGRPWR